MRRILHDARIELLCKGLRDTRIDVKAAEIERLKQALHDARIENSGQAAELEREKSRADAHYQNYLQMLERIDQIAAERSWIPVEERLPKEDVPVLCVDSNGIQMVAWSGWGEWCGPEIEAEITHWMPLPEPPKEEVQG